MKNIAVFASGSGSNAQNLIRFFHLDYPEKEIRISLIVSNCAGAYVLTRARMCSVPAFIVDRNIFYNTQIGRAHV
jgi:phosphoribosylglycinamide formyltransferase-1